MKSKVFGKLDFLFLIKYILRQSSNSIVEEFIIFEFVNSQYFIHFCHIVYCRHFFEGKVLDFVTQLTGFPLNGTVDMFLSNYQKTGMNNNNGYKSIHRAGEKEV